MSITHEEARRLIQYRADDALKQVETDLLETHISSCPDCEKYAASISGLETTLQTFMSRRWNRHPLPLLNSHAALRGPIKLTQQLLFATRIIAMGLICLAVLFNFWQFNQSGKPASSVPPADIPPIPTPSMQSTTTQVTDQACEPIIYPVRKNDTLESIADQFSISPAEIIRVNQLRTLTLDPSMALTIPVCSPTPPGTSSPVTKTYTPLLGPNTLTPIHVPTQ